MAFPSRHFRCATARSGGPKRIAWVEDCDDGAICSRMQLRRGSNDLGMQLGDVMARYSWHVDSLAAKIATEPARVRQWLLGEELPEPHLMLRLLFNAVPNRII